MVAGQQQMGDGPKKFVPKLLAAFMLACVNLVVLCGVRILTRFSSGPSVQVDTVGVFFFNQKKQVVVIFFF